MSAGSIARRLIYESNGAPLQALRLASVALPEIQPDEVLIKFKVAPINPSDINQIEGVYKKSPTLPAVGGNEGVAEVVNIGKECNTSLQVGDWVIPRQSCLGTWTTHYIGNPLNFVKVPKDIDVRQVGTVGVNPATAYRMLHDFVNLQPGDYILQNGATSAVGQSVIQLARIFNLKTINIIRHRPNEEETLEYLKGLGADEIIFDEDITSKENRTLIHELHPRIAFNCIGGKALTNLTRVLLDHTPIVTYGGMSKKPVTISTSSLIFQDLRFFGFWITRWNDVTDVKERMYMLDAIFDMIRSGDFKTNVTTHGIENWEEAISAATASYKLDKHVFLMNEEE